MIILIVDRFLNVLISCLFYEMRKNVNQWFGIPRRRSQMSCFVNNLKIFHLLSKKEEIFKSEAGLKNLDLFS